MNKLSITVDGCDYTVEELYDGDLIRVIDATGYRIANAERDHACEDVYFSYFESEEGLIDSASQSALYRKSNVELASWLVATHPCV